MKQQESEVNYEYTFTRWNTFTYTFPWRITEHTVTVHALKHFSFSVVYSPFTFRIQEERNLLFSSLLTLWDMSVYPELLCQQQELYAFSGYWTVLESGMFGNQTRSNIVWWPNMLTLYWVARRYQSFVHVVVQILSNTHDQTWPSIKPGVWNIPELPGTSRNIAEHPEEKM